MKYRDNYCSEMRKAFGHEVSLFGHRGYALNVYRFGSLAFPDPILEDKMQKYDFCMAYIFDGKQFTVSLYSEKIDVSIIAQGFGGGGHKGAAGFVCYSLPGTDWRDV